MAGCSDREIVQILKDVSSITEVENRCECIRIKDIQQQRDFSAYFVKGKSIKTRFIMVESSSHKVRTLHFEGADWMNSHLL